MQPQANAPDGTAVTSKGLDLGARVRVLEEGLARTINLVDDVVKAQTASLKLYGAIEALLVDVSKSGRGEQ